MTEFNKLSKELQSLGWTKEYGSGDHVIFRKEGHQTIVLAQSMNHANRGYQNCIAEIRRKEPLFTLGKQQKKKTVKTPEETEPVQETDAANQQNKEFEQTSVPKADKTFVRAHKWIVPGVEVVHKTDKTKTYTVTSINDIEDAEVLSETDIISLKPTDGKGEEILVFPEDIDSATQRTCICCGESRPENWFGSWYKSETKRNTCRQCIENPPIKEENNNNMEKNFTIPTANAATPMDIEKVSKQIASDMFASIDDSIHIDKQMMSTREVARKFTSSADKIIQQIQAKLNQLNFANIPTPILCLEMAKREQLGITITEDHMGFNPTEGSDLLKILEQISKPEKTIKDYTSQELYQELKDRGYKIIDGKFKRIVEETLE